MESITYSFALNQSLEERTENDPTPITDENGAKIQPVSEFRTLLPQVLASTAKNLILLDLGMTLAFPTIAIAALHHSKEALNFSDEQASWFGSIALICQPAGSVVSGLLFEPLGRKRAMLLVNVPHIISWLMLYFATTHSELFTAAIIMGIGVGFMEAPIITYVGEISQPKWRGVLTSYAGLFVTFGYLLVYFLGAVTNWQTAALICTCVPIISILVISQVPESPIWLLSKNRIDDAEKSLCWLRGWVHPALVQAELHELRQHNSKANNQKLAIVMKESFRTLPEGPETKDAVASSVPEGKRQHHRSFKKIMAAFRLDDICRRQTLQPLLLVIVIFFFQHAAGITSTRPFMVEIFKELGSPIDSKLNTVISSFVGIIGNIVCMATVGWLGKKSLAMWSLGACTLVNLGLCVFGIGVKTSESSLQLVPVILYMLLTFSWSFGMGQIPWMLTSEVFPFRGRGVASGVSAAASYILGFIVTKTYINFHNWLTLPGVFGLYSILSLIGCLYFYYFLPETEGKSLEEIETILENKFSGIRSKIFKK